MSRPSRRRLAQTVVRLLQAQPSRRPQILRSVGAYLIDSKQVRQLHLLIGDVARVLEAEGHVYAEVHSACVLDDKIRASLQAFLKNQTNAQTVELDEHVEPSLLAGVVVRTPRAELDTSAKHKLMRLASLTSGGDR